MKSHALFYITLAILFATGSGCASASPTPISPDFENNFLTSNGLHGKEEVLFAGIWGARHPGGGTFVATDEGIYIFNDQRLFGFKMEPTPEYLAAVLNYKDSLKIDKVWQGVLVRHKFFGEQFGEFHLITTASGAIPDDLGKTDSKEALEIVKYQVERHGGSL